MIQLVGIIVPTVVGIGLLVSLAVLARDAWERLRGPGWMSRRCGRQGLVSTLLARGQVPGDADVHPTRAVDGLRSRRWYAVAGAAAATVSVWALVGSWGNYIGWRSWLEGIAWLWVVFLAAGAVMGVAAAACLVLLVRPRPPAWVEPLVARTPLGRPSHRRSVATTVVAHPRHVRRSRSDPPPRPLGHHQVTDGIALAARTAAGLWTLVVVTVLGWMTLRGWIPATPEELDVAIAGPAWVALYVLLVVASLAAYRWDLGGAVALLVLAALLALLSSIQYEPWVALLLAAAFAVPAFLHWLAWQRDHHVHHLVRVAAGSGLVVALVWLGAGQVYAHYFGPTHPDSTVVLADEDLVEWAWAGGVAADSVTVVARTEDPARRVRLAVDAVDDGAGPVWSAARPSTDADLRVVRLTVRGLRPGTAHTWAVEVDGRLDRGRTGRVRTMPVGPASFTLAVGACARAGSDAAVFDAIRRSRPLAYLVLGDLHYANIGADDPGRFRAAMEQVLTTPGQSALYRSTATAYVWDDHDYAANDGDRTSPSRPAAQEVYRSWVPHHPLASGDPLGPIGQSFVAGRVRVVLTDTRSQRTPPGTATGADQQMLGPEQEAWFASQLDDARRAGQVVVWATSSPWIGPAGSSPDTWAGYPDARRRAADLVARAGMSDRLVMVAGDAHMVALDDGTNTDESSSGAGGFPLLQAAALDRPGSVKGGPYSGGTFPGGGRYGEVQVRDTGGPTLEVTLRGRTWDGRTLVEQAFSLPAG